METIRKVQVAIVVVAAALCAVAAIAAIHGFAFSPLDEIGGVPG